jgi:hypothetical protein
MPRHLLLLLTAPSALVACAEKSDEDEDDDEDDGDTGAPAAPSDAWQYLPLEGQRAWEYAQCVPGVEDCTPDAAFAEVKVEKQAETVVRDGSEVVTLHYENNDNGDALFSIDWSSDREHGIRVWGWRDAEGQQVVLDPPILVSDPEAAVPEPVETTTGAGLTYTSTLLGEEACRTHWVPNDPYRCLHFRIEGGDGTGPLVGDWWFSRSWGTVRFETAGWSAPWTLSCAEFENDNC